MMHEKLVIIGSGPAGLTAALYAARADLNPIVFEGLVAGGQLMITTDVENYPGFPDGILGPELMDQFRKQAERFGTRLHQVDVTEVDFSTRPFRINVGADEYTADAVIIATGASATWLGVPGEEKLTGKGVSACATCDGFFFRDKELIVVGGGDTAMEEALFLTKFASKVTVIHRRDELRAEKILQHRLFNNPKVEMMWNHQLDEVVGAGEPRGVEGVRVKHSQTGAITELACKGVFIAIGHAPSSELVNDQLELHSGGYVVTAPDSTATSIPGVFAAGDITDHIYRQAVTSAGMGCMAALEVEKYLTEQDADAEMPETQKPETPADVTA